MFESPSGYTGHIFESEVLGTCRVRAHGYIKFNQALSEVKENQPNDPHHPIGEAGEFHKAVASVMGVDPDKLELYTAVGSSLDIFHGIGGFFSFEGVTVTVDVTANSHKDNCKARVLVCMDDAENGYKQAAAEIADQFKRSKQFGWTGVV